MLLIVYWYWQSRPVLTHGIWREIPLCHWLPTNEGKTKSGMLLRYQICCYQTSSVFLSACAAPATHHTSHVIASTHGIWASVRFHTDVWLWLNCTAASIETFDLTCYVWSPKWPIVCGVRRHTFRDNHSIKAHKYVCTTTYQPDTKFNPSPSPDPNSTTKQHAIANIQLNILI